MAERHLRKCSASLVIGDKQIKTTLRYYLIPVRMAKVKNTDDSLCWRGCGVRGTPLLGGVQTYTTALESNMEISQKSGKQ